MAHNKDQITATPNAVKVFNANPDLALSANQLADVIDGTIIVIGPPSFPILIDFGCIKKLRYGKSDTDLVRVEFDSGANTLMGPGTFPVNCINLNDFRERFQEAANFGHGVSACLNRRTKELSMLNIIPCACTCDKREQYVSSVPPVVIDVPGTVVP